MHGDGKVGFVPESKLVARCRSPAEEIPVSGNIASSSNSGDNKENDVLQDSSIYDDAPSVLSQMATIAEKMPRRKERITKSRGKVDGNHSRPELRPPLQIPCISLSSLA